MFSDQRLETMPRSQLAELQLENLNRTLQHALQSEYYGKKLAAFKGRKLTDLNQLQEIGFTTKDDLRQNFPYGFLCVDLNQCVRLHSSSGTTGTPTVVFHTQTDLDTWTDLLVRDMVMVGVTPSDVFQNMMGYGLFTGGLGFHYGGERLGALTIPSGPGNSKRQIWFMQTFKTTVIHILPSYALHLISSFQEMKVDPKRDLNLKIAFIGAEPHSEEIRRKIEDFYGIKAYNSYGLSEMCGPGVAFECPYQSGLHLWEDFFYMEIIDPISGKVLPDGEEGELVLTTLQKQAMPLLRYRTRDLTRIIPGSCPCGRTHRRIERIKGRSDDMLILNGVNIFPIQIEKALMKIPEIGNHYIIEIHKQNFMDKMIVKVELNDQIFGGTLNDLEQLQHRIGEELKAELVISPSIKLVEPGSLPVSEGKAKRVFDLRQSQ